MFEGSHKCFYFVTLMTCGNRISCSVVVLEKPGLFLRRQQPSCRILLETTFSPAIILLSSCAYITDFQCHYGGSSLIHIFKGYLPCTTSLSVVNINLSSLYYGFLSLIGYFPLPSLLLDLFCCFTSTILTLKGPAFKHVF